MRSTILRKASGALVGVVLAIGSLPATASEAGADTVIPVAVLNHNWPRAAQPGSTVTFKATLSNLNKTSQKVSFRFNVWCFNDKGPQGRWEFPTAWKSYTVPGRANSSSGVLVATASAVVPAKCAPPSALFMKQGMFTGGGMMEVKTAGSTLAPTARAVNYYVYAAFNKSNYAYNLTARTAKPSADAYQAHHTLPQKFEPQFKEVGLNIHDPGYLRWWCSKAGVPTNHAKHSARYNSLWQTFFEKNPGATKAKVLDYRSSIQGQFKYTC